MSLPSVDPNTPLQNMPQDLSLWHLFSEADIIVQIVLLLLIAGSLFTWAIIFSRSLLLKRLRRKADLFEDLFWSGTSLDKIYAKIDQEDPDPLSATFVSAMKEWEHSTQTRLTSEQSTALQGRIERVMNITMNREIDALEGQLGYLASIGSTAPFVGLFGTVWGIMNSLQGIAASQSTNLAVVAPGIAEALFATAIGLVVAIPAILAYNKLSGELNRFSLRLSGFIDEFVTLLSRQLEER